MPRKKSKKSAGTKIIAYLTDWHVPYHDEEAAEIAIDYVLSQSPDTVIFSEVPDFYKVSRWKKDPSRMPFIEELDQARIVIRGLNKKFAKQEKIYIQGNHEERLQSFLWTQAEELAGLKELRLPKLLRIEQFGWEYIDNKKRMMEGLSPHRIGHLTFLHGHEIRMGWGAINLAKIYYERCRTNVIVGHHHRCQEWIVRTVTGQHEGAWLVGCLAELNPEYMPHNDWVHGFALVHMYQDGSFRVENRKIINRKIL